MSLLYKYENKRFQYFRKNTKYAYISDKTPRGAFIYEYAVAEAVAVAQLAEWSLPISDTRDLGFKLHHRQINLSVLFEPICLLHSKDNNKDEQARDGLSWNHLWTSHTKSFLPKCLVRIKF